MSGKRLPKDLEDVCAELIKEARAQADTAKDTRVRLAEEASEAKASLSLLQKKEMAAFAAKFAAAWKSSDTEPLHSPAMIDDPVYQHVVLDKVLSTVLHHPLVQRLNYIKQLSFAYLQFPSATHTRLAHSLGAARNAELAMQGMLDRGTCYCADGERELPKELLARRTDLVRKAKVTALLHDLGHGPFGHALDKYIGFLDPGDPKPSPDKHYTAIYIEQFLRPTLEQAGLDLRASEIAAILRPQKRYELTGMDALTCISHK
jgi:HD domain